MKKILSLLFAAMVFAASTLSAQDDPAKSSAKKAGKEAKAASKDAGKAMKKEGKEMKHKAHKEK